jgi:hypothetical protein
MRRALATALTGLVLPTAALATTPYQGSDMPTSPVTDKALIAHQRAAKARSHAAARVRRHTAAAAQPIAIPANLAAIANCESGGNPSAIGGGGAYRGAFQMTYATWASVGGSGDPAAAPMQEQVRRAAVLYARAGAAQWPNCAA